MGVSRDPERRAKSIAVRRARNKKTKIGRQKISVSKFTLEELAAIGHTDKEIALILGMSDKTFQTRKKDDPEFLTAYTAGVARCRIGVRMHQQRLMQGDGGPAVNMVKHVSAHQLGEFDRPIETHKTVDVNIEVNSSWDRISAKLDDMQRRMLANTSPLPQLEIIDVEPERVESGVAIEPSDRGAGSLPSGSDEGGGS
jgi:hypothetical protein